MTRPTRFAIPWPQGVGIPGGDPSLPEGQPPVDCCDDEAEIPDRALDGAVFIGASDGDGSLVQSPRSTAFNGVVSLDYLTDPVAGHLLVAALRHRNATQDATITGWTLIDTAGASGRWVTLWSLIAPGGPVSVATSGPVNGRLSIMEFASFGTLEDSVVDGGSGTLTFTIADVTTAGGAVLVGAVATGDPGGGGHVNYTEDPDYANVDEGSVSGGLTPESNVGYRVVGTGGTYDYVPTGSISGGGTPSYGGILAAFAITEGWILAGPEITDGDDATCQEVIGSNVLRLDLGAAFEIARVRLVIECETAGPKTYTLKGANVADFSDAVTVATLNFTATGSFTADTVTDSWMPLDSYQYWELTGDDETRNVCTFSLYEQSLVVDVSGLQADIDAAQDDIDDHIADAVDAHDASAVSVLDSAGWFAATDAEAALAEVAAKVVGYQAHGAMGATETFNVLTGWHSGTFDANCTFTLSGAVSAVGAQMLLELAQNGTGGWTITLPSSVSNKAQLEADQDTTASTTSFLILMTRDGGTTWYGFWAGGSGSSIDPATTVEDETTFGITPAVGTDLEYARQDHTHGTPEDPFSADAVRDAGRWELAVITGSPPDPLYADGDYLYIWVT